MPSLLFVTTVPATLRGFLVPIARHFRLQGWHVDALTSNQSTEYFHLHSFDHTHAVKWSRNPLDVSHLPKTIHDIRKAVQSERYDIVHVHTPVAAFITRYALRKLRYIKKVAVIYTAHGFHFHPEGHYLNNAVFIALERLAGLWTDELIVINHEDEDAARRLGTISEERIHYMPGIGVDLDIYNPLSVSSDDISEIRKKLGLQSNNQLFGMIAEFIPRKRHQDVLQALKVLNRSNVHLAFAGTGPLMDAIRQLACDLGVQDRVHFLGQQEDIRTLVRASSAILLLSSQEGLPRSVMEALCLETPVIGSNIRGTRDLIGSGGGLIVNVSDVEGIARAMAWILDNPDRARALGQQARSQMQAYDLRRIITLHEDLYTQALARVH